MKNRVFAAVTVTVLCLSLAFASACNQSTIAALVQTLGNASASVAALEGNTVLAETLKVDSAAAVAAINNWKNGAPAQLAIQALNLVLADLNLFPGTSQYAPLIALAVTTAEAIIAILAPPPTNSAKAALVQRYGNAPKSAAQFKTMWNGIAAQHACTANAAIK